jgi:hypothetical protein
MNNNKSFVAQQQKPQKYGRIFGWKNLSKNTTLINETYDGSEQAIVTYYPNYLCRQDANALLEELQQRQQNLFQPETWKYLGKTGLTRRESVAFGTEGLSYTYAGRTTVAVAPSIETPHRTGF